jgi:streptothricin acetyltransferase
VIGPLGGYDRPSVCGISQSEGPPPPRQCECALPGQAEFVICDHTIEVYDAQAYVGKSDHAAWLAYVDGRLAGQILIHENWNRFAIVWDIAVDPPFRRRGVGRRLIEQAVALARTRRLPGVMLETQNINMPACRLYERCGFVLGGFDAHLYRGVMPGTREIALFWYLLF